jgi:hypothetical protein
MYINFNPFTPACLDSMSPTRPQAPKQYGGFVYLTLSHLVFTPDTQALKHLTLSALTHSREHRDNITALFMVLTL